MPSDLPSVVDVVCVGGGLGGLAVAAAATAAGLDTLVLEAADTLGGAGAYSGGLLWAPGEPPDAFRAAEEYLSHLQGERSSDTALRHELLRAFGESLAGYAALGVPFEVVPGNPDVYYPQAPGSVAEVRMFEVAVPGASLGDRRSLLTPSPHYRIGLTHAELHGGQLSPTEIEQLFLDRQAADHLSMGAGLTAALLRAAQAARIVTGARVDGLVTDEGGAVVGVRAGDRVTAARRGVVLATGGYGWAPDAAELDGLPDYSEAGPPTLRGDHLGLAEQVGAAIVRGSGPQFALGARALHTDVHPGTDVPLVSQLFDVTGLPHSMIVNRAGQRFGDESYYVGINVALSAWDPVQRIWPNFPCWLVVDEEFRRTYPLATIPAQQPYPDTIHTAPSLVELATVTGIDPAGLVVSVARFNRQAEHGVDADYGRGAKPFVSRRYGDPSHKPNACLGPVATPPFHAIRLRLLGTGLATFGLSVDARARVRRRNGSAVPGLFAAGVAAATTEVRGGYITGYANTRTLALAHRAVRSMITSKGLS